MSDRFNGQIWIGGQISRTKSSVSDPETSVLDMLMLMINDSGGSYDWEESSAEIQTEADFNQYLDEGVINLKNTQARNGEFEELEYFCQENGIPYIRISDSYCEYDAEERWWEPGMKQPDFRCLSEDESPMIMMDSIRPIKKWFEDALSDVTYSPSKMKKQLQIALDKLNELDKNPPQLPKFEVVE